MINSSIILLLTDLLNADFVVTSLIRGLNTVVVYRRINATFMEKEKLLSLLKGTQSRYPYTSLVVNQL